jgi:PTS system N-acetylgalactosamine-specific IIA component
VTSAEGVERRAVLAGHGSFAEGMLSVVRQIIGPTGRIAVVTNTGATSDEIERRLKAAIDDVGATVIFTDLPAGSCTMAARRLQRTDPRLTIVMGANAAAILEFVMATDVDDRAVAGRAAESGRGALAVTATPPAR